VALTFPPAEEPIRYAIQGADRWHLLHNLNEAARPSRRQNESQLTRITTTWIDAATLRDGRDARGGAVAVIDETRQLRWYLGLGLAFLAIAPLLMFTLLAFGQNAPRGSAIPLIVGGPVSLAGFALVVRSMLATDRDVSARYLKIGAVVVLIGDVLLYGIHTLAT